MNNAFLAAIIESSSDAIYSKDLNSLITSWNKAAEEIFGYPAGEILGRSVKCLIPIDHQREEEELITRIKNGEKVEHFQTVRSRKDGQRIEVSMTVSPIKLAGGEIVGASIIARDISGQKRAERRARWLASFPERNPNPIVEFDPTAGGIGYANPSARELFPNLGEMGGSHPLLWGLDTLSTEMRCRKDKLVRRDVVVEGRTYSQTVTSGEDIQGLRIYSADITERAKAEQELRVAEGNRELVIRNLTEGLVILDITTGQLRWNPAALKMHGLFDRADWLCGLQEVAQVFELLTLDRNLIPVEEWPMSRILRGETLHDEEVRVRRLNGNWERVFSYSGSAQHDETHKIAFLTIRDVTSRRAEEERFRAVVEASPSAMIMVGRDGKIALVNRRTEDMFGYTREELIGQSIELLVPQASRSDHKAQRDAFLEKPVAREMGAGRDLYGVRKDGSQTPVEIGLSPMKTGEGTFVLASIIDITARKLAEEALRDQAKDLARSNGDLEQFAYVASHDLQEPLRAVAGCLQVLERRCGANLDARAKELIKHSVDGAKRMQALIEALLEFSRVGTHGGEFRITEIDDALDDALKNLDAALAESGAAVTRDPLPRIKADRLQISLLFQNLIANAIKFRSERPLQIHVGAVHENGWTFTVRDNGIGIDARHFERIFLVFQRLHTWKAYPGTGIGLAICKRIVERHGGRIWVDSARERGSTFSFNLPSDFETRHSAPAPKAA